MPKQGYPTADDVLGAVRRSVCEEADALRRLVNDPDADCISRDLRAERLRAYEHVLAIVNRTADWEW